MPLAKKLSSCFYEDFEYYLKMLNAGHFKLHKMQTITDSSRIQQIKNSIAEGRMILSSGKSCIGRKMNNDELEAVKRQIRKEQLSIGEMVI